MAPAASSSSWLSESCGVEDVDTRVGCSRFNVTGTRSKIILVRRDSGGTGADITIAAGVGNKPEP